MSSITDCHSLCLNTKDITEEEVVGQIKQWMSNFPGCKYIYSIGKDHHQKYLNFAYLWVDDKDVYFSLLNITEERESRVETVVNEDGSTEYVRLPPVVDIDPRIRLIATIVTPNEHASTLIMRPCPPQLTADMVKKIVLPFSTSDNNRYPNVIINAKHDCAYIKFDPFTFDANFADKVLRRHQIVVDADEVVYDITFRLQRK